MTGILYGRSHFNSLKAKEIVIREEETKKQAIRDAQLAEEKLKNNRRKNLIDERIYFIPGGKLFIRFLNENILGMQGGHCVLHMLLLMQTWKGIESKKIWK